MVTHINDPISLEVFRNALSGVAEEMGEVMRRTALSPMIKERNDRSCAVFAPDLQLVAQAEHLPIHLALLINIVPAALAELGKPLGPGDICLHNDPYVGGSHLPDLTMISAVHDPSTGELLGYCAVIAHHGDIGGSTPGGVGAKVTDILQEGVVIPPLLVAGGGVVDKSVISLIKANVRRPAEIEGDLYAQMAALQAGSAAISSLATEYGQSRYLELLAQLLDYSRERAARALGALPAGVCEFTDVLDDDGTTGSGPLPVSVRITIGGGDMTFDFAGSASQRRAPVNASLAVTQSAVLYAVRCLIDPSIPTTSACFESIQVLAPQGTIVHAQSPAPVAGGSLETAQRIVDVLFGALAQLLPEVIPAAGMGSHNSISIGGYDAVLNERYVLSENLSGGGGARPERDGLSARRVNLMNTPNNPIEVVEREIPIRIEGLALRRDSAGRGKTHGGYGIRKEYLFLEDADVTVLADRSVHRPWGLQGGTAGKGSRHTVIDPDGTERDLGSKFTVAVRAGTRLVAQTAGGGGFGTPTDDHNTDNHNTDNHNTDTVVGDDRNEEVR
ncbi:hypothetical protein A8M60_03945 [Nocardia farcinica]|nr:hypothetical protein A8M60_03945 [Nocardia farcinica]